MSRKKQKAEDDSGAIDLTPMLDVVFIMLIFFIVTASFIKEAGIEVDRPDATKGEERKPSILVAINDRDEIWIDKRLVDERRVRAVIEQMLADNPKGTMVVQADIKSKVKTLAHVVDTARHLGVANVAVATEKK